MSPAILILEAVDPGARGGKVCGMLRRCIVLAALAVECQHASDVATFCMFCFGFNHVEVSCEKGAS